MKKLLSVIVLLTSVACSDAPSEPSGERPASINPSSSTSQPLSDCGNHDEVIADPALRRAGELIGDVDADGTDETIAIAVDEQGEPGCVGFLIVESSRGSVAVPIDEAEPGGGARFFNLRSVGAIDTRPGLEIVVNALAGASTEFVFVFSAPTGTPELMTIEGGEYGNMFPTGGSVGHIEATDCVGAGEVVVSEALPRGDGYEVTRRFFAAADGVFTPTDQERVKLGDPQDLESLQEFVASPFGSCSGLANG